MQNCFFKFYVLTVWVCIFLAKEISTKAARKMMGKIDERTSILLEKMNRNYWVQVKMIAYISSELTLYVSTFYAVKTYKPYLLSIAFISPLLKYLYESQLFVIEHGSISETEDLPNNHETYLERIYFFLLSFPCRDHQLFIVGYTQNPNVSLNFFFVLFVCYYWMIFRILMQMLIKKHLRNTRRMLRQPKKIEPPSSARNSGKSVNPDKDEANSNVSKMDSSPTLFFHSCLYGHRKLVRFLLSKSGNEIDASRMENTTGSTAFHLACTGGHLSVVQQLMTKFGHKICNELLNRDGQTGLELAVKAGRKEVVRAILNTITGKNLRFYIFFILNYNRKPLQNW